MRARRRFGAPTKPATKGVAGSVIDLELGPDLLEPAVAHDRDAVAHGQRFLLVVRDVDERDAELLLVAADLDLHLAPELAVEIGERLVEQQQRRPRDQAARQRHALLLAARELVRIALLEALEAQQIEHPGELLRCSARLRPCMRSGNTMFSATVRCGNSRKSWNTMPMLRA